METKIEAEDQAEPEKKIVTKNDSTAENSCANNSSPVSESPLQRLTPALLVSVSILISSGILAASSFAKPKNLTPEVRNFYYQLPPPGPYMSNLAIPQQPKTNNRPMNFRAPQMNRPNWARPTPPWIQNAPNQKQDKNLSSDQNSASVNPQQNRMPPNYYQNPKPTFNQAPPWSNRVNRAPQFNGSNWARPTPPPWYQAPPNKPKTELSEDQKAAIAKQPHAMQAPNYRRYPTPNFNPGFNQAPPAWVQQQRMMPPTWARPAPPWVQQSEKNNTNINK